MKMLVTGGAGFMGSDFVRYILKKYSDYEIVNLDKLTYCGNLDNLKEIEDKPRYRFVKGDIADSKIVDSVLKGGVEVIINFAAETHVDRSILDPDAFIRTDILGTHTLLEAARRYHIKRYIQISTDEVYGSIGQGSFTEDSLFQPNSPYSASKAGADLLVRAYVRTYGFPAIVTHGCNNFGPYQYPEKVIPLFITNLIEGKKVPLYGTGKNTREWIYVRDHSQAVDALLHHGVAGEVYNIGSGNETTNHDLTMAILKALGKDESMIEYVKDRPAHDLRYSLDASKLRSLGWQPEFSFQDGLALTVSWYKHNDWWWKKIKSGAYLEYYKQQYGR